MKYKIIKNAMHYKVATLVCPSSAAFRIKVGMGKHAKHLKSYIYRHKRVAYFHTTKTSVINYHKHRYE